MSNVKYNSELIGLPGIDLEFQLCHIPFLVVDDVFGVLALEGSSGTGKTTLVNRIGKMNQELTGGKVKTYSADKVRYEDFNGCPIPNTETKSMDIFFMPNSISQMETVLIDEINRASYDNQEKFLSLFASREVDGIPSKCKYIYTAMNPILSEQNDEYEGVQPVDKALGERMIALVKMTPFHQMPTDVRLKIIQSCFNQTSWTPQDSLVKSFGEFIEKAKCEYRELKEKHINNIAQYIDSIQSDLVKETKSAIKIEARRAQYILVNVLAVHALNSVFKAGTKHKLEQSALQALLISFPNSLWEQVISKEALRQAHQRAKILLDSTTNGSGVYVRSSIERSLKELKDFISKDTLPSVEQVSKLINQELPDVKEDPINHYLYACGLILSISDQLESTGKDLKIIKNQELERMRKIYDSIVESNHYKKIESDHKKYSEKDNSFPTSYKYPDFIFQSSDPDQAKDTYSVMISMTFSRIILSICSAVGYDPNNLDEVVLITEDFVNTIKTFKEIYEAYNK